MTTKRRTFSPEFKREAADLVLRQSYSYAQACEALGVGETALRRWVDQLSAERNGVTPKAKALTPDQQRIQALEKRVKRQLLEEIQAICPKDITILHVRQGEAKGLGHAVLKARPIIGNEPFAVVLPDVILDDAHANLKTENLSAMLARYKEVGNYSQIMVEPVPMEQVSSYGVVDCAGYELAPGESKTMTAIVEKPPVESAPSNLAVVGRYVLSEKIWDLLKLTPPGAGDEIQLTDAIAMLMEKETVEAFHMTGKSHDCGSKLGYMKANVEYGLRHPELAEDFKQHLKELLE